MCAFIDFAPEVKYTEDRRFSQYSPLRFEGQRIPPGFLKELELPLGSRFRRKDSCGEVSKVLEGAEVALNVHSVGLPLFSSICSIL